MRLGLRRLVSIAIVGMAVSHPSRAMGAEETMLCVQKAAARYHLPYVLIDAIRVTEGGRVGAVSKNTNGTYDIGPMQINSIHLPRLAKIGISEQDVRDNGCLNIHIGAWILQTELARSSDVWTGIGRYHSATPEINQRYQQRVWRSMRKLAGTP